MKKRINEEAFPWLKTLQKIIGSLLKFTALVILLVALGNTVFAEGNSRRRSSETTVQQQQITVRGTVRDDDGNTIPGVNVVIEGTLTGVTTDIDGNYTISVPANGSLVFSYVGMETATVAVNSRTRVDVVLEMSMATLEQVVVIGYQEVFKRNTTASVVSASAEMIENAAFTSFESMLQGKLAGVNIQNLSGAPGVKNVFVIRGNTNISTGLEGQIDAGQTGFSNPLYVVDGVPTTLEDLAGFDATNTNFLASLNTNDIESIDILKDASAAAIYGSRGANGVVIITTKKGRVGKPVFTFNAYGGVTSPPDLISVEVGAAERRAKYDLMNNYWTYGKKRDLVPLIFSDSLNPAFNNNVDYQGIFYQPGRVQNYDFGVSGGTETINYRVSLGYFNEEGIVTSTGLQRLSLSLNLGVKLSDKLENQSVIRVGHVDRETGLGSANPRWGTFPINPLRMNSSLLYLSEQERDGLLGRYTAIRNENINISTSLSNNLRLKIIEGLYFNNTIALGLNTTKRDFFAPTFLNSDRRTYADYTWSGNKNLTIDNYASYIKKLGIKHEINALLGHSINYNQNEYLNVGGRGASSDQIQTVTGIDQANTWGGSNFTENGMLSYWSRLGYKYDDKYIIDLNFRTDGSSRFGSNTRWGYFPAVSAGWIFSEEALIKDNASWIDFAKLRGSWGINGSQFSDDYLRFNSFVSGNAQYLPRGTRPISTYNGVTTVTPNYNRIANEDLSWEESVQWSVGMDLELFGRRLYFSPEIYNRETRNLLFDVEFPIESGFTSSQANIAGVRNYGWELSLSAYTMERSKEFQWVMDFNVARNYNQVTKLPNGGRDWQRNTRNLTVGLPMNQYYVLNVEGVYSSPEDLPINPYTGGVLPIRFNGLTKVGQYIWTDVNKDHEIVLDYLPDSDIRIVDGKDPNPRFTGGWINTLSYKNFNLRVATSYVYGRTIFNYSLLYSLNPISWGGNNMAGAELFARYNIPVMSNLNYWRQPGDDAKYANMEPAGGNYLNLREYQSIWLEDGSYFKINNVTLSYNFEKHKVERFGLNRLRVYAMVDNVAIFQNFSGPDAERVDVRGYDNSQGYAQPIKVTLGVNVAF